MQNTSYIKNQRINQASTIDPLAAPCVRLAGSGGLVGGVQTRIALLNRL